MRNIPAPRKIEGSPAFQQYSQLTMPPGALEQAFLPALRVLAQREHVAATPFGIRFGAAVFAGDHGIASAHPVSAFPVEVTGQMVSNFLAGGAAMSVLCKRRDAHLYVVDVGVASEYAKPPASEKNSHITYVNRNLTQTSTKETYAKGARDISTTSALSLETFNRAFQAGEEIVLRAIREHKPDVMIFGEMGIGNTTPAAAIISHCLKLNPAELTGVGTGIDHERRTQKATLISKALQRHAEEFAGSDFNDPELVVRSLGGFELAAIAGAACAAAQNRIHILLDGVIATASILPFALRTPELRSWLISGHRGAEPAHRAALAAMDMNAMLDLNLRLGEGSGAAFAAGIMQDAVSLLNEMATFASAEVSGS